MKHPRGFSLLELLFALSLVTLLFGLGFLYMRGGVAAANSHSLALVVAEHLRQARQSAIATEEPVAVVLPAHGPSGTAAATCQSLYIATGLSMAHVSQVVNLANDHPGAELSVGLWPVTGTAAFSLYPSLPDQRYSGFNVTQWLTNPNLPGSTMTSDCVLIFQPDGSVLTNGMPFLKSNANSPDAYYILATAGGSYAASNPPPNPGRLPSGLAYFSPTSLARPWTIGITPGGDISVNAGLPALQPGTVALSDAALSVGHDQGAPLPVSPMPAFNYQCLPTASNPTPPAACGCWFSPTPPDPALLNPGVNMTLEPGQLACMAVNVSDTSGRDLYVQWTCTPSTHNSATTYPSAGNFSFRTAERMNWDATQQVWTSKWDWLCPINARNNEQFTFTCQFGNGTAMASYPQSSHTIEALKGPHLWVTTASSAMIFGGPITFGPPRIRGGIFKGKVDGSALRALAPADAYCISVSQDGAFVVEGSPGGPGGDQFRILSGFSGQPLYSFTVPGFFGSGGQAVISPRGNRLALATLIGGRAQLQVGPVAGPWPTISIPLAASITGMAWSPDEKIIAFAPVVPINNGVSECLSFINATGVPNVPVQMPCVPGCGGNGPNGEWVAVYSSGFCFQPDGNAFFFSYQTLPSTQHILYKYDLTHPSAIPIPWSSDLQLQQVFTRYLNNGSNLAMTPDGQYFIYTTSTPSNPGAGILRLPNNGDTSGATTPTVLVSPAALDVMGAGTNATGIFITNN